jgi:DNA-binding NarL/FixJ family response regulator
VDAIRIVLAEMPKVLRSIVSRALDREHDMSVIAENVPPERLQSFARESRADVVVVRGYEALASSDYRSLLFACPHVKIVAISSSGHDATLSELRIARSTLMDVSPGSLVEVIREAVREPRR